MGDITREITRGIREGLWIEILYDNPDRHTQFWVAIKDIEPKMKIFVVEMYNPQKGMESYQDGWIIYFDKIVKARVIEGTFTAFNEQ